MFTYNLRVHKNKKLKALTYLKLASISLSSKELVTPYQKQLYYDLPKRINKSRKK